MTPEGASPSSPREPVPHCLACQADGGTTEVEVRAQMMPRGAPEERFTFLRCPECGLVRLAPRVPARELGPYYTDGYLPYRGPEAWGPFAPLVALGLAAQDRKRVELVQRHAGVVGGTPVLDVGCGKPTFLEALVEKTGCAATGIDFSDSGWREAPDRWSGIDLVVGDIHELQLQVRAEVVTMWHYLEHDYDPVGTLRRLRELATGPGARLFIEVPDHDSWTRQRHGACWAGYHAPRHTALYDPGSMTRLLQESGWAVVEILRHGSMDPYILHWMSRMEARGIDWSAGMAARFPGFLAGKVAWWGRFRGREDGLGVLTAVARPDS